MVGDHNDCCVVKDAFLAHPVKPLGNGLQGADLGGVLPSGDLIVTMAFHGLVIDLTGLG